MDEFKIGIFLNVFLEDFLEIDYLRIWSIDLLDNFFSFIKFFLLFSFNV